MVLNFCRMFPTVCYLGWLCCQMLWNHVRCVYGNLQLPGRQCGFSDISVQLYNDLWKYVVLFSSYYPNPSFRMFHFLCSFSDWIFSKDDGIDNVKLQESSCGNKSSMILCGTWNNPSWLYDHLKITKALNHFLTLQMSQNTYVFFLFVMD